MFMYIFLYLLLHVTAQDLIPCTPPTGQPTCVCETNKGTINLTSIVNNDGTPRFSSSAYGYNYNYNPCYPFSIGDSCGDGTAVCQLISDGKKKVLVGKIDTEAMFSDDEGNYQLQYSGGDDKRTAVVYLFCDYQGDGPSLTTEGDHDHRYLYVFNLTTTAACLNSKGRGGGKKSNAAGPIGIVLISLALSGFVTYFVVGILISKFHLKKSGTDIIPQKQFWFALPFLIKDGVVFTFSPIIRLIRKDYKSLN